MSKFEYMFDKLPRVLRRLEDAAGMTFVEAMEENASAPMIVLADAIARRFDDGKHGYTFGTHADNAIEARDDEERVAVRMKSGMGVIVPAHDDVYGSVKHSIDEMTAIDLILFATDVITSMNGSYMLVRYDQLACYANPYMRSSNDIWDGYEAILSECRSVVVDVARDFAYVSMPYYKFRNMGECDAYSVEAVRKAIADADGKLVATEKLDGSMVQMRYVAEEDREDGAFADGLLYSTSKALLGSVQAADNDHIRAIRRYHLTDAGEKAKYLGVAKAYPEMTFIYEFVHPDADRHVVLYDASRHGMYMTGARNVETGRLATHDELVKMADAFGIPYAEVVATSLDEVIELQRDGDGSKMEGVVINIGNWLVKAKLDGFLALSFMHHELEGPNGFKSIAQMYMDQTLDDAMPNLTEPMREYIDAICARFASFEERQRSVIDSLAAAGPDPAVSKKDYALYVNSLEVPGRWRGWLFQTANDGVECFWADKKGAEWRWCSQSEFEEREADLDAWLAER